MCRLALILTTLVVTACGSNPLKSTPQVVEVPGPTKYVPIPEKLTQPCPIEEPRDMTPLEAVRVAKARRDSIDQCNRDKAAIRAVQGTKVP